MGGVSGSWPSDLSKLCRTAKLCADAASGKATSAIKTIAAKADRLREGKRMGYSWAFGRMQFVLQGGLRNRTGQVAALKAEVMLVLLAGVVFQGIELLSAD
jgi:hypothetical protein